MAKSYTKEAVDAAAAKAAEKAKKAEQKRCIAAVKSVGAETSHNKSIRAAVAAIRAE